MHWRGTSKLTSYGDSTVFQRLDVGWSLERRTLTSCLCLTLGPSDQVIELLIEGDLAIFQCKTKSSAASAACSSIDGG
ncbi:hypothetical protein ASE07_27390 [Noviherbaspirillum sp. Root189]|nr:hypothetical protein ASE07_27390 [Noviherbaspirillum sp. Root189]